MGIEKQDKLHNTVKKKIKKQLKNVSQGMNLSENNTMNKNQEECKSCVIYVFNLFCVNSITFVIADVSQPLLTS